MKKDFEILELNPAILTDLTADEKKAIIKKRYYALSLQWHPDKNSSPEATEKFQQINDAYERLVNQIDNLKPSKQPKIHNPSQTNIPPKANPETKTPEQRAADTLKQKQKEEFKAGHKKLLDARMETLNKNGFLNSEYEKYVKNHKSYDAVYNHAYESTYKTILDSYKQIDRWSNKIAQEEIGIARQEIKQEIKNAESASFWGWLLAIPTLGTSLGISLILVMSAETRRQEAERTIRFHEIAANSESPEKASHEFADEWAHRKAQSSKPLSREEWESKVRHDVIKTEAFQKQLDALWKNIHTRNAAETQPKAPGSSPEKNAAYGFSKA